MRQHQEEDNQLARRIQMEYVANREVYGSPRLYVELKAQAMSMSRRGICYDNAVSESFFGTLKRERIDRGCFQTRSPARQAISEYTEAFYNLVRRHSMGIQESYGL